MKTTIIFIILVVLWGILFVRNTRAEAPIVQHDAPKEIQGNPIKEFAYNQVKFTWGEDHWKSFNNIIQAESQWDSNNKNPASTAYGLGQFLDSTWNGTGFKKTADPQIQIAATIVYISDRYGNPNDAWKWWTSHQWY